MRNSCEGWRAAGTHWLLRAGVSPTLGLTAAWANAARVLLVAHNLTLQTIAANGEGNDVNACSICHPAALARSHVQQLNHAIQRGRQ